jgi:LysM repeat protein
MRRIAHFTCTVCVLTLLAGCEDKNENMKTEPAQSSAGYYDSYADSSIGYEQPSSNYYASDAAPMNEAEPAAAPAATKEATTTATHVVAKGDTLIKLARMYYSDQSRWKEIYEANSTKLSDPNRLRIGQELVIP